MGGWVCASGVPGARKFGSPEVTGQIDHSREDSRPVMAEEIDVTGHGMSVEDADEMEQINNMCADKAHAPARI